MAEPRAGARARWMGVALLLLSGCSQTVPDAPSVPTGLEGRKATALALASGRGLARLVDGTIVDLNGTRYFDGAKVRSLGSPPCVIGTDDVARCRFSEAEGDVPVVELARGVKQIVRFVVDTSRQGNTPFACVLTVAGGVRCGLDQQGDPAFAPTELDGAGATFLQIGAGRDGVCGRTATGRVRCWPIDKDAVAVAPAGREVAGLDDVVELAVGDERCARRGDGSVWCWGNGEAGACVIGDGSSGCPAVPVRLPGAAGAVELAVGSGHACARLATGRVRCWGFSGLFADQSFVSSSPKEVPSIESASALAVGDYSDCAIVRDGTVICWGTYHNTGGGSNLFFIPSR